MMKQGTLITRRAALSAAAAGAAAVALAGCAGQEDTRQGQSWEGSYLPIGSTVRLEGVPAGIEHVVVARRVSLAENNVADYALIPAVYGLMTTLSEGLDAVTGEVVYANEDDIVEVKATGSQSDDERRAEELLSEGRVNGKAAYELLEPLVDEQKARLDDAE